MPKTRIDWNNEEIDMLAEAATKIAPNGEKISPAMVNRLQHELLPANRQRKISAYKHIESLTKRIAALRSGVVPAKRVLPTKKARQQSASMKPVERVRWATSECEAIVSEAMLLWRKNPVDGINIGLVSKAMHKTLPENRWRKLATWQNVKEIRKMLEAKMCEIIEAHDNPVVKETVKEIQLEPRITIEEMLAKAPLPTLMSVAMSRFTTELMAGQQILTETLAGMMNKPLEATVTMRPHQTSTVVSPTAHVPRVAVIGLIPQQEQELVKVLGNESLKLTFIDKDKSPNAAAIPQSADHVIMVTKFIPHKWRDVVLSVAKEKLIEVRTINDAREELKVIRGKFVADSLRPALG